MASMRDIKRRKESIQSTQQITKAMKLVSTVKLQKARSRVENSKEYFTGMYSAITSILARSQGIHHPYLVKGASDKAAIIAVTSNRGLAGGYNSNITKLIDEHFSNREAVEILAIGRKGKDILVRKGFTLRADYSDVINEPIYKDASDIGIELLHAYKNGEIGEIYLAYTVFKNTVSHEPKLLRLLPIEPEKDDLADDKTLTPMNFEVDEGEVLDGIIPKYVCSMIYGALLEASASENGARMTAMDAATSNAEEMIEDLALKYNRARQGSITQEITEIIAGAQAIS